MFATGTNWWVNKLSANVGRMLVGRRVRCDSRGDRHAHAHNHERARGARERTGGQTATVRCQLEDVLSARLDLGSSGRRAGSLTTEV